MLHIALFMRVMSQDKSVKNLCLCNLNNREEKPKASQGNNYNSRVPQFFHNTSYRKTGFLSCLYFGLKVPL